MLDALKFIDMMIIHMMLKLYMIEIDIEIVNITQ